MSSRSSSLFVALACGGIVASSSAFAISACSSNSEDGGGGGDAGGNDATNEQHPAPEAGELPDSSKLTLAQCKAKCAPDHPTAVAKEDAIDKCWADNCTGPCIDQSGGFDGGDGGGGGDGDGGGVLCGTSVPSGIDTTCDQCTQAFCCTAWQGCFNDPDCTAYDTCVSKCR